MVLKRLKIAIPLVLALFAPPALRAAEPPRSEITLVLKDYLSLVEQGDAAEKERQRRLHEECHWVVVPPPADGLLAEEICWVAGGHVAEERAETAEPTRRGEHEPRAGGDGPRAKTIQPPTEHRRGRNR